MPTKYSVLFFFLVLVNENYFAFKQYRSLTDKSHCSNPLKAVFLRNESDEAVITWQGGVIQGCRISVRPWEETANSDQMCLSIVTNNIPCDKNVTLSFITKQDLKTTIYLVGCNVKPVKCMIFKTVVMIKVSAPYENATRKDTFQLRLKIVVSLIPTITEKDVSPKDVTTEHLDEINGVCQIPVNTPNILLLSLKYCLTYRCSTLVDCISAFIWDVTNDFDPATPRRKHHEAHKESKLDVNSIIAISGGVVTSLFIPIILLAVKRKMQTAKNLTVIVDNPEQQDKEERSNRQSLISEDSFQTI
ncbi:uncharacterized protein LOC127730741 [Mytilus californianus]|uniref:uncharacterized protein LOC127730741 n=1 Tax=Mytilus californianus TaxID=6549 RepID=UPI0022463EAB|nr:uncharacterized protein LOC127730741 [Mytilus californianus]XP_052095231.1 uncharacterized protein LOC127730741 [Mytilus californianus]XP_052095232.1 uncharacterized protein LOC127730741 [Mytilus californianus]